MLIYTKKETVTVEQNAMTSGISQQRLMENAGSSVAREIRNRFELNGLRVTVLCGNGNNGGDGFVAARRLFQDGADVKLVMMSGAPVSEASETAYGYIQGIGLPVFNATDLDSCERLIADSDVVIDAIYGFGYHGELPETVSKITRIVNKSEAFVVSVDIPSGAECDGGICAEHSVKAQLTVTFVAHKPCHVLYPSVKNCGQIVLADIGIPKGAYITPTIQMVDEAWAKAILPRRAPDGFKGTFGTLSAVCGSYGMCGAAEFAAKSAMKSGVGLVKLSVSDSVYKILAARVPEAVYKVCTPDGQNDLDCFSVARVIKSIGSSDCLLFGCGCGDSDTTYQLLENIVGASKIPVVLDADGINALSRNIDILRSADCDVVLTPHYGEMARLCGITVPQLMTDRLGYGSRLADQYGVAVVMKGARTLIFLPDGRIFVNLNGNSGMGTAGSGDMLAGLISGLICQGAAVGDAAVAGVYIHAMCGDIAALEKTEYSMTVTDMIDSIHTAFAKLTCGDD